MVDNEVKLIYHSKIALLYYISTQFKADMYFYNDISTFHFKPLENVTSYPNPLYIESVFKNVSTPILFTINPNKNSIYFIQGGCFGGKRNAIEYLKVKYYTFLNDFYK